MAGRISAAAFAPPPGKVAIAIVRQTTQARTASKRMRSFTDDYKRAAVMGDPFGRKKSAPRFLAGA
jgi:hypothetical protein